MLVLVGADVNTKDGDDCSILTRAYIYCTRLEKQLNNSTNKKHITAMIDSLTRIIQLLVEEGSKAN